MSKDAFLKYLKFERRFSLHTIRAYENDLNQFESYISNSFDFLQISKSDHKVIRKWIVSLLDNNISTRSIHRKISTLKSYFKYLLKEGIVSCNPLEKVVSPKVNKKLPLFIENSILEKLFDSFNDSENYESARNLLIIEILYSTGIRVSELVNLKLSDIDFKKRTIKVLGKRNKERIIPYYISLGEEIIKYLNFRNQIGFDFSENYLFLTSKGNQIYSKLVYNIVRMYLSKFTTLEKKGPHILRHTFATHLLNNGADLNAIKELLGHANLSATQIYTHNSFEKLKNIYKLAHPRA